MKPLANNNVSFWAGIGLLILFSLPYVGNLALIICAFFIPAGPVKTFARTILIISVVLIAAAVILVYALGGSIYFEYEFPIIQDEQLEVFRNILNFV